MKRSSSRYLLLSSIAALLVSMLLPETVFAAKKLEEVAKGVTGQLSSIANLLVVAAYVAGVGFALMGITQFKAHKDQPTQVPLSKPIVYLVISACLLFLPTVMKTSGQTVFETEEFGSKGIEGQ